MRRIYIIAAMAVLFFGNVFSQNESINDSENIMKRDLNKSSSQKQAVFVDLFPLMEGVWEGKAGGGLFYERRIHKYFSVAAEANFYTDFNKDIVYCFIGHGRVYPFQTTIIRGFVDVGLGYRSSKILEDDINCLDASVAIGWKFILGKGFMIEPAIGYRQNILTFSGNESQKGGITINIGFGWAF